MLEEAQQRNIRETLDGRIPHPANVGRELLCNQQQNGTSFMPKRLGNF